MKVQLITPPPLKAKTKQAPAFGGKIVFHADNFDNAVSSFSILMQNAIHHLTLFKGVRVQGNNLSEGRKGLAVLKFDNEFDSICRPECDSFSKQLSGIGITAKFEETAK